MSGHTRKYKNQNNHVGKQVRVVKPISETMVENCSCFGKFQRIYWIASENGGSISQEFHQKRKRETKANA